MAKTTTYYDRGLRTTRTVINGGIVPLSSRPTSEQPKNVKVQSVGALTAEADLLALFQNHIQDYDNPHRVTREQLGNDDAVWNASRLQNIPVSEDDPTTGQFLSFDGSEWVPTNIVAGGVLITSITGNYTPTNTRADEVILANASTGSITVTLPSKTNCRVTVKKTDASANAVVLSATSIDGSSTQNLWTRYTSVTVVTADGSNWWVI